MSNLANVSLAFFKEKKVKYYYNKEMDSITFPCFRCLGHAEMDTKANTCWKCLTCESEGNLKDLIDLSESNKGITQATIYNPKKELIKIQKEFQKLTKLYGKDIENLHQCFTGLVNYYEANKTPSSF